MYRSICVITLWVIFVHIVISARHEDVTKKCSIETECIPRSILSYVDNDEKMDLVFKCCMTCVYIRNGILAPDGRMRTDTMYKSLPLKWPERDALLADWQNCGRESLSSGRVEKCEVGFAFFHCFNNNITDRLLMARKKARKQEEYLE